MRSTFCCSSPNRPWNSLDAIRRFVGEDYEKARYYQEDRDFLIELEPFVEHYDVVGGD